MELCGPTPAAAAAMTMWEKVASFCLGMLVGTGLLLGLYLGGLAMVDMVRLGW